MPIYEFYCRACHRIYSFFSTRVDTETRPDCPKCGLKQLERQVSKFSTLKHRGEEDPGPFGDIDEERLQGAMDSIAGDMDQADDMDDPRRAAKIMRQVLEAGGMETGPRMEEYLRRLESGRELENLDSEMEDLMDEDESVLNEFIRIKNLRRQSGQSPPEKDDTLYFL